MAVWRAIAGALLLVVAVAPGSVRAAGEDWLGEVSFRCTDALGASTVSVVLDSAVAAPLGDDYAVSMGGTRDAATIIAACVSEGEVGWDGSVRIDVFDNGVVGDFFFTDLASWSVSDGVDLCPHGSCVEDGPYSDSDFWYVEYVSESTGDHIDYSVSVVVVGEDEPPPDPTPDGLATVVYLEGPGIQNLLELTRVGFVLVIFLLGIISVAVAYRDR